MSYKILAINPGSTSIKIALYEDETEKFSHNFNLNRSADNLLNASVHYEEVKNIIISQVENYGYSMKDIDAYAGRGGVMVGCASGVYEINDLLLAKSDLSKPIRHPMVFVAPLLKELEATYGGAAYVLNSQHVDELQDLARVTGFKGIWRECGAHVLNQKEVAQRTAELRNKKYEDLNLIIAHLGGGISITAHKHGLMIDSTDGGRGDGPMAPTRAGSITNSYIIELAYSGKYTKTELMRRNSSSGGLMDHLGIADARVIEEGIKNGDTYAKLIYEAMIYQIIKNIGSMATVLEGKVDGIILTGGLANSSYIVETIKKMVSWIAPVSVMAGEFEMECLSRNVLKVLKGEEQAKTYTDIPTFDGNNYLKLRKQY